MAVGTLIPTSSDEEVKSRFPYMKHLIFCSKLLYIWPSLREEHGFPYHVVVCFIVLNSILTQLSFFVQILIQYENLDSTTELIDITTAITSAVFRLLYIYFRGGAYLNLVHLIHTEFISRCFIPTPNGPTLDRYYKLATRAVHVYSGSVFFWILQMCFVPAASYLWNVSTRMNDSEVVPYPVMKNTYAPFDIRTQPNNSLFYAHQSLCTIYLASVYVLMDSFWYTVISLTIGQFILIKDSINTMAGMLKDQSVEVSLMEKEVEYGLKRCIKHHQFVRRFVHLIDDISNPLVMVDFLQVITTIVFILLDVTISLNAGDWNKLMYTMEYFITSIIHLYLFDWLGNELAEKEEELSGAVYEIPWYRFPTLKTNILLMSMQSRRPYRLTGGRMYKLSLDFFSSKMKAVFSYFTFLLQLRNK